MHSEDLKETDVDEQIENARKNFYKHLMSKKRSIRRNLLEISSVVKEDQLETLSYRAMLNYAEKNNCIDVIGNRRPTDNYKPLNIAKTINDSEVKQSVSDWGDWEWDTDEISCGESDETDTQVDLNKDETSDSNKCTSNDVLNLDDDYNRVDVRKNS